MGLEYEFINKKELLDKLHYSEKYNTPYPKWIDGVIKNTKPAKMVKIIVEENNKEKTNEEDFSSS